MRAIRIHEYGGPDVLLDLDLPVPQPGAGEVLVRVAFAGVNFMDVHTRQGKYRASSTYPVRAPLTLGMEGAGVVVAVGDDVAELVEGDRVAWCISWGSYAEYAIVPVQRAAKVPDAVPLRLASAAMFQGSTAHYLTTDVARLAPGMTCLVHAGSGAIGQLLIQLAKRAGAVVFSTASSPAKREAAQLAGADTVLGYDDGAFAEAIRDATDGGVDVVFDAVGKDTLRASMRATRTRGLLINYGSVSGSLSDLDPIELGESGSLVLTRPRLADHMRTRAEVQRRADDVFAALVEQALSITTAPDISFDEIPAAHAALEERRQVGKAVLDIAGSGRSGGAR